MDEQPVAAHAWCASADAVAHAIVAPALLDEDSVVLDGADAHHLARVRRITKGEAVTVADGGGRWRPTTVAAVDGSRVVLRPTEPVRVEPMLSPHLAVAFVPAKGDQPEAVTRALTELGVDSIVLAPSRRSVVRWDGERAARALERLQRVAREAAQQARRARVPDVRMEQSIAALAAHPSVLLGDPRGDPVGPATLPDAPEWLVVVGPEGGLDDDEIAALAPRARLAVGPHILRAATAPIALAAAVASRRRPVPGAPAERKPPAH